MQFETLSVGPLQCNCTILGDPLSKEAAIIDPGDEAPRIAGLVGRLGFRVKYLLHTHGHFDHIGATASLKESVGGEVCAHADDIFLFERLPLQGKLFGFEFGPGAIVERRLEHGEQLTLGEERIEIIHTPGHSPGGLCFKVESRGVLFSGDTLFQNSIGRTDLWGADHDLLIRSIRERLFPLDSDYRVIPGHGPETKLGYEKRSNPFLR